MLKLSSDANAHHGCISAPSPITRRVPSLSRVMWPTSVTLLFLPATGRRAVNSAHLPGNRGDGCITGRYIFTGLRRPRDVAALAFIQTASFPPLWMQLPPDPSWKGSVFFKMNLNHRGAPLLKPFFHSSRMFSGLFLKTHTPPEEPGSSQPTTRAAWGIGRITSWLLFIFIICTYYRLTEKKTDFQRRPAGSSFHIIEISRQ